MPRAVAVLRARLAQPAAQQAGPESQAADFVRLAAKPALRLAPVRRVAVTPDEPPQVVECVREVVPQQVAKPEARLALAQPVEAALDERLPVAVEHVPEVAPRLVAERVLAASPRQAVARAREVSLRQGAARVQAVSPRQEAVRPAGVEPDERQQEAAAEQDEPLPVVAARLAAAEQDEPLPVVAAPRTAQALAEVRQPVVLQAALRPASRAPRPGPVQHALARTLPAISPHRRSQSRPGLPEAKRQPTKSCQPEAGGESCSFRLSYGEILPADSCEQHWRSMGPL